METTVIKEIERSENEFAWNVIAEKEFKQRVREVFSMVADALSNTLGPYGATTIIEKFGDIHITKDGWQLLKKIKFQDQTNANILQLLSNISGQVVIKVGDGSTTSIISSDELLKAIEANEKLRTMRPKELLDSITEVVNKICDVITANATQINKDEDSNYEDIRNIALVSTNGDTNIADMVQTIYKETQNPTIEFIKSKTTKTSVEIIHGYKMPYMEYIDGIFINNDEGTCNLKDPFMVMFDHKIDRDYYDTIIHALRAKAMQEGRKMVVFAPYFDNYFLDKIRVDLNKQYNSIGETLEVYVRASLMNGHMQDLYNDFAALCGATIINESLVDEMLDKEKKMAMHDVWALNLEGCVDKISIGDKATLISGFCNKDEHRYELMMNDAISKYNKQNDLNAEMSIVSEDTVRLKQRISKLKGIMGSISVGGGSELEKTANYDLVEDAVRACESAYTYGYNIGQNIPIHKAITSLILEGNLPEMETEIAIVIGTAFKNVLCRVIQNKQDISKYDIDGIIGTGVMNDECFDLVNEKMTKDIITSCRTDIEILKATTSIIGLLISSNQYISIAIQ